MTTSPVRGEVEGADMPRRLLIIRNRGSEAVLAARIVLDGEGGAHFFPGEDYFGEVMAMIGSGVYEPLSRRFVTPHDGDEFLDAVALVLSNSTAWTARFG
jgi:hypothetical protein